MRCDVGSAQSVERPELPATVGQSLGAIITLTGTDESVFSAVHLTHIIQSLSEGFNWIIRELKCHYS